ncbi:helix-turn-helix domain-containing protein [Flavobacterium sp. GCM10023249]|uniref:helix-turn-helix domain-containing protein n=1 Tax=unclassified Flavobacterium TaxID=196869 RepID=UPI0036167825
MKKNIKKPIDIAIGYYMHSTLYKDERAIHYLDSVIKYSKNTNHEYFPLDAYREKAYKLRQLYRYDEAIQNYILAENLAKQTNLDFYFKIRLDIAEVKSEELLQVDEALILYRECLKYYEKKDTKRIDYFYGYNQVLFDIADAHKALKNNDSATYYNRKGFNNCVLTKDDYYKYLFVLNEGANLVLKKKYSTAIDSINIALPKMIEFKNKINIIAGYYYLGHAYRGLNRSEKAIHNFKLLDSAYQIDKKIYPEFVSGYNYLIAHYRKSGNKEMELKYVNRLMAIDSFLYKRHRNIDRVIRKNYEIPHLMEEKESKINTLENKYSIALYGIVFFVLSLLGLFWYNRNQKKIYKKRFTTLTLKLNEQVLSTENNEAKNNSSSKETIIADELVNSILMKLEQFEKKKEFLDNSVSIQQLAEKFETNTKYLSKIINEQKQVGFVQYVNDLRIEYALKKLQSNAKLRKYTIIALANEFGFNTGDAFSSAFFRKTGIKPSFYLKELNNISG